MHRQVDDDGDVLGADIARARVSPDVLVDAQDTDVVIAGVVVDQAPLPFVQDGVVRGVSRKPLESSRPAPRSCAPLGRAAPRLALRENFACGAAAAWRHTREHPVHAYRHPLTSRTVGRHPNGSCAGRHVTVSRIRPGSHCLHQSRRPSGLATTSQVRVAGPVRPVARSRPDRDGPAREARHIGSGEGSLSPVEVFQMGLLHERVTVVRQPNRLLWS